MELIHASCVCDIYGAILLRGPSGSGKSDLALRLIDQGALLVADDYVNLSARNGDLIASAPDRLRGLLEVRGLGLMRLPGLPSAVVRLVVDLVDAAQVERLPESATTVIAGIQVPAYALAAFEASTPAKIRLALRDNALIYGPDENI